MEASLSLSHGRLQSDQQGELQEMRGSEVKTEAQTKAELLHRRCSGGSAEGISAAEIITAVW